MRPHRIAVVIPAFNEQALLPRTLAGVPELATHVVVVDDASTDKTADVVRGAADARVDLVSHQHNQGVGAAIRSGYLRALQLDCDAAVVMAADNQMKGDEVPRLVEAWLTHNADYVKGNRFIHSTAGRMPALRRLGSAWLSWLTRQTTGLHVDDCQCGFTLLDLQVLEQLSLDDLWPRYGYPNDLLALLAHHGRTVVEVPVSAVYESETSGLHAGHVLTISARIIKRWLTPRRRAKRSGRSRDASERTPPG